MHSTQASPRYKERGTGTGRTENGRTENGMHDRPDAEHGGYIHGDIYLGDIYKDMAMRLQHMWRTRWSRACDGVVSAGVATVWGVLMTAYLVNRTAVTHNHRRPRPHTWSPRTWLASAPPRAVICCRGMCGRLGRRGRRHSQIQPPPHAWPAAGMPRVRVAPPQLRRQPCGHRRASTMPPPRHCTA